MAVFCVLLPGCHDLNTAFPCSVVVNNNWRYASFKPTDGKGFTITSFISISRIWRQSYCRRERCGIVTLNTLIWTILIHRPLLEWQMLSCFEILQLEWWKIAACLFLRGDGRGQGNHHAGSNTPRLLPYCLRVKGHWTSSAHCEEEQHICEQESGQVEVWTEPQHISR